MSKASLFFLFNHKGELYIVDNNHVQDVPKPRELIRRFSTIEQIREHALHLGLRIANDSARERTKHHTPEGLERIRQAKIGDNHPAVKNGRGPEFREKVSKTMSGTRGGENNPMYGRQHSKDTRIKMSYASNFKIKRRWCVSPEGITTTIPITEPLPEGYQPDPVFVVKGTINDANGTIPEGTKLYLQYAQSRRIEEVKINAEDGRFASVVQMGAQEDVLLIAEADGIAFEAQVLYDHEQADEPVNSKVAMIDLEPAEDGEAFEIGEIQFQTNSSSINRTSLLMLELFSAYLLRNEAIGVHVIGHTDDRGESEANQLLSEQRAKAVAEALHSNGVERQRISHEGKGETAPIMSNDSNQGRSRNRRTEFEIRLK